VIWKPVPDELAKMLDARLSSGGGQELSVASNDGRRSQPPSPDNYLIPGRAKQRRDGSRDDRVVYLAVKRVAKRAGVTSPVHALRAAVAVQFDEAHPEQLLALKDLMGHKQFATTEIYLRRRDKARGMEAVRDLTFPQIAGEKMEAKVEAEKEGIEPSMEAFTPITP
jgi:integrase